MCEAFWHDRVCSYFSLVKQSRRDQFLLVICSHLHCSGLLTDVPQRRPVNRELKPRKPCQCRFSSSVFFDDCRNVFRNYFELLP